MSSITIKDIPDTLLERLRRRAREDNRSMNREVIYLLDMALAGQHGEDDASRGKQKAEDQIQAWRRLAGRWESDRDAADEISGIYQARTQGRPVDL